MKITIDCPEETYVMFVNYVYRDGNVMLMGSKSIDTDMLKDGAERTADRSDIWQDRFIYWIAVAVYHLILEVQVSKFGLRRRIEELEQRGKQ